jgi:hypothetical protein
MHPEKSAPGADEAARALEPSLAGKPATHRDSTVIVAAQPQGIKALSKAPAAGVRESLTEMQCASLRSEALRFGYALTWAVQPCRGLTWYARRGDSVPVVLGNTAAVHRFLAAHQRWDGAPGMGKGKMDRWARQKARAQAKRAIRKAARSAAATTGAG